MDYFCLIQVRLEGREIPVDIDYSQGTSVQAVLERACRTLGIYDSWNYALYSELFKTWLCESHLLSSYPAEDTLIVRKKTPEYLELVYNEENPKKRLVSSNGLSPNTSVQTIKRRGVFSSTKTCLKTRFQPETIYLSAILFTSDNKVLITSSAKMFPTVEIIKDGIIFGNVEDDSEEFAHVIRTSLDWATSTEFDNKEDNSSDTDSLHSTQSNSNNGATGDSDNNHSQFYGDQDTQWSRAFGQAALRLKNELSLESLGILYEHVVSMNTSKSKFIVTLQHVPNCIREEIAPDLIKSGTLKWKNFEESNSIYQKDPHPVWSNYIDKWCSRQTKLSPGLYLGVLYTESTLQGIKILVPKDRKQFIPLGKVRDEATITPEEASWVKSLTCLSQDCFMDSVMSTKSDKDHKKSTLGQFQTSFLDCYYKLQHDTSLNWESSDIYSDQTVDIYLDLQTNQMYTMMGELDDNIIEQCGNFSSSPTELFLDPNVNNNNNNNKHNNNNNNKFKNIYKSSSSYNISNDNKNKLQEIQGEEEEEKDKLKELQKSQKDENSEEKKQIYEPQGSTQDEQGDFTFNVNFDSPDKENFLIAASAPESEEEDDEGGSMVKTCTSTGAATSIAEEVASHMTSSITSFNTGNTIRPFIRIIMIVKPMRQPHHIRGPYYSRLCMLYPFPLYDALQHATFNTSLYACSRRAMQILQASRTYFTQELVRHLQKVDNFSEVNEQNLEDFFFDPDEFNKFPDDARRVQQALDVIRDEIVTLRQQWNAASWTMTAIEWDRQRTMQAYSFGGRPMTLNVSKSAGQSRAASVYNLSLSNNNDDNGPNRKRLSTTSRVSTSDTVSHIEILRDVMFHAPDRAWNYINLLGIPTPSFSSINNCEVINNNMNNNNIKDKKKKQNDKQPIKISSIPSQSSKPLPPVLAAYLASLPVIATPTLRRSPSISSTISTISSNASSGAINPLPARKKSAGHRLMRTFGFGGNRNNNIQQPPQQQNNVINDDSFDDLNNSQIKNVVENSKKILAKRANSKKLKDVQIDDQSSIINFESDDTITIIVPPRSQTPIASSFTIEPTELEVETMEIHLNDKSEEHESSTNSQQEDVEFSSGIVIKNFEAEDLDENVVDTNEHDDSSKVITENEDVALPYENKTIIESKSIPNHHDKTVEIIEFEFKSKDENVVDTNEHDDSSKVITENEDVALPYENKTIIESNSKPNNNDETVEIIEFESKSTSQMESFTMPYNDENDVFDADVINRSNIESSITFTNNTSLELATANGGEEESPTDESSDIIHIKSNNESDVYDADVINRSNIESDITFTNNTTLELATANGREEESRADESSDIIHKKTIIQTILDSISEVSEEVINENIVNDMVHENESEDEFLKLMEIFDNFNNEESTVVEKGDDTDAAMNARLDAMIDATDVNTENVEPLYASNKLLAVVSEDSMQNSSTTSNSTSTCTSTTHTTTTSATDTPLSSRASSSPSTPHPHPPPSTPTNGLVLSQSSLSNASFPLSSPTTPHFPPPLFLRSIPPTPYFSDEILHSPETSIPETPDFPPPEFSNEFSAPPTPQLVPQTLSEIDSDSPLLAPLSSPSSETPLHASIPSTPQFSPSAHHSRPSTPQLNALTLFEELKHATYQLVAQTKSPPSSLYEESIHTSHVQRTKSPPPFQYSRPPTPQVSPPISPSSLPPLPLSTPSTPRSVLSPFSAQASSNTTSTGDLPEATSQPSTTKSSSPFIFPRSRTTTPPSVKIALSDQAVPTTLKSPLTSPIPSLIPRPPIVRSLSLRSITSSSSSSSRPPPLPLPPTWPTLKKTKRPEPKKDELKPEFDQSDFHRKPRSRATSFSEGSDLELRNILHANNHPQRAASELGFHDVAELNNNVRVDFEQQKIINDNDETKITSNNNSVKVNGSKTSFIKSQTKNNKNLFIIKKLKKLEINTND